MTDPTTNYPVHVIVYAIVKDEIDNIEEFCKQFETASCIVFLDTGSTDGTYQKLIELRDAETYPLVVEHAIIDPFDFSRARNMCLGIAQKYEPNDLCNCLYMWADLDERISKYWYPKLLEFVFGNNIDLSVPQVFRTNMVFKRDDQEFLRYAQNKIHTGHTVFEWKYACHEILFTGNAELNQTQIEFDHKQDNTKERDYLPILKNSWEQNPYDLRNIYYYGRELFYNSKYSQAEIVLEYVKNATESVTLGQQIETYLLLGQVCENLAKDPKSHYFQCLAYFPDCFEAHYRLCAWAYSQNKPDQQLFWGYEAADLIDKANINVIYNKRNGLAWRVYDYVALAHDALGEHKYALYVYSKLLEDEGLHVPQDAKKRIMQNVQWLTAKVVPTK